MNLPYLHFFLDVGFFRIRTELWRRAYDNLQFNYIVLRIHLFKWSWEFELYSPDKQSFGRSK